jgi:hypothetical protein
MIRGSVDIITPTAISGWAYAPGQSEPVLLQAVLNHEILGEAHANIYRPDLHEAGLGDGRSGYAIKLFRPIDPIYLPFIVVKVEGGDTELPRAPLLGFSAFFTALYAEHPAAGRHRSLLGGLWTSRTDAAALLRSKTELGHVPPVAAPVIQQFIYQGFAVSELDDAPMQEGWRRDLPAAIGALLEARGLIAPLRAILEDHPLVVRAEWVEGADNGLVQPSQFNPSPSPAECIEILLAFGDGVSVDLVRDSHLLPEFTPRGVSRWSKTALGDVAAQASAGGLLDRHALVFGAAMLIDPGTLYRVRCPDGAAAIRILCLPSRNYPAKLVGNLALKETVRANGVRVLA